MLTLEIALLALALAALLFAPATAEVLKRRMEG